MLLLPVLLPSALACTPDYGLSLVQGADLPVDARGLLVGTSVASLVVTDASGEEIPVTVSEECYDGSWTLGGSCYTAFVSAKGEWAPGAVYTATYTFWAWAQTYERSVTFAAVADGHRVTPTVGVPDVGVEVTGREPAENMCEYPAQVFYTLTLTPASADPDGISFLRVTRTDGYSRYVAVPADGLPFVWEPVAPESAEDCFTVIQVDGAGALSGESAVRCAPEAEDSAGASEVEDPAAPDPETPDDSATSKTAAGCGCNGSPSSPTLLLAAFLLRRRRA